MLPLYINEKSQVILEVVIVFVCLAIVAIAATRLFSNLNMNMLGRMQVYRGSRLDAVNNPARLGAISVPTAGGRGTLAAPVTFLDYSPKTAQTITPGIPGTGLPTDPRLEQADKLRQEAEDLVYQDMAQSISEANALAQELTLVDEIDEVTGKVTGAHWEPPDNIEKIKQDCQDAVDFAKKAIEKLAQAEAKYEDIRDHPGAYEAPEEGELKAIIDNFKIMKTQMEGFLALLLDGNKTMGLKGLNYIVANIGGFQCESVPDPEDPTGTGQILVCSPTAEHKISVTELGKIAEMLGSAKEPTGEELGKVPIYCTPEDRNCCTPETLANGQCVPYGG